MLRSEDEPEILPSCFVEWVICETKCEGQEGQECGRERAGLRGSIDGATGELVVTSVRLGLRESERLGFVFSENLAPRGASYGKWWLVVPSSS